MIYLVLNDINLLKESPYLLESCVKALSARILLSSYCETCSKSPWRIQTPSSTRIVNTTLKTEKSPTNDVLNEISTQHLLRNPDAMSVTNPLIYYTHCLCCER